MPTEDEIYLSSTQYRYWTFTPSKLASMRTETNNRAKDHVRSAIARRKREASSDSSSTKDVKDIEFLTVEEEKELVDYYCSGLMDMIAAEKELAFQTPVIATAVQYIKRFYLTNSVMSYHPRSIMITALFLATKIEHQHISARKLAAKLNNVPSLESITAEDIPAPEYILTQGLLFNLDIRHPHRALKGAFIELQMLLELMKLSSTPQGLESLSLNDNGPSAVKEHLTNEYSTPETLANRTKRIYHRANDILKTEAILSDAYFLYTPPQIVLAALLLADEELALDLYNIRMKKRQARDEDDKAIDPVLETARSCASLLKQAGPAWRTNLGKSAKTIDRKLHFCKNPEKADLVERHRAQKRDATIDGKLDEGLAKKRRLEREKNEKEADDLFGPSLTKK